MVSGSKRLAVILLLVVVGAGAISSRASASPYLGGSDNINPPSGEQLPPPIQDGGEDGAGGGFIAYLIDSLANTLAWALGRLGCDSFESLVFNEGKEAPTTVGDAFTEAEWDDAVMPWYRAFSSLAMLPVLVAVVVAVVGLRIAVNPQAMSQVSEMLLDVFIAAMILVLAPNVLRLCLSLNSAMVDFIKGTLVSRGLFSAGTAGSILDTVLNSTGSNSIIFALVNLNLVFLTVYFNVIYLVRKIVLALMLITLPLVIWTWTSRKARVPVLTAFSEILTNSLMSASHAILFGFFLTLLGIAGQGPLSTWWAKLIVLNMIIPLSALIRRMLIGWMNYLGVSEERMAGLGMAGLAGVAGLARIAGTTAVSTTRFATGLGAVRTAGASLAGAAAKSLQPGQSVVQAQVMRFGKDTARLVDADKRGFDVPMSRIPLATAIGDRFNLTLGADDPATSIPKVEGVMPARSAASGGGAGQRPGGLEHNLGRAVGGFGKLVAGTATFGTPASRPMTELAGSVGYSAAAGAARLLPEWYRRYLASRPDGGDDK